MRVYTLYIVDKFIELCEILEAVIIPISHSENFDISVITMVPGIVSDQHNAATGSNHVRPLKLSGALDQFKHEETTPVIGREFIGVNIVDDLLNAEDADARLRDLAITSTSSKSMQGPYFKNAWLIHWQ